MIAMTYNGLSLQTGGLTASDTDVYSAPERSIQAEQLAQSDGSVIVKQQFLSKKFTVSGQLKADTIPLTDTLIDTFKNGLNATKQNFDIDYAGSIRRYIATPRNMVITRPQGMNQAGWSVEFFCESPVGMDTTTSTLVSTAVITSSTQIIPITVGGSYKAEPAITLTLTSGTGLTTNKTITIANDADLRGISITRNWTAGDVLEINSMNRTVYVNSIATASSGIFPSWQSDVGGLSYTDDFTTRSVSISASYSKRYL